jgi:enoyl-CoA hydratase
MSADNSGTLSTEAMARLKENSPAARRKALVAREPSAITYESVDGVALITINRPPGNWLNMGALEMLHDAWIRLNESDDRCAVITGTGNDAFVSGMQAADEMSINFLYEQTLALYRGMPGGAVKLKKPLIGAAAGTVFGGGVSLCMVTDILVAAENTVFTYPEAKYSVGAGMIAKLPSRIPHKVAMELMLVGDPMSVQRAYEIGFVNEIVPVGQQVEAAMRYARRIADNGPIVVSWFKTLADSLMPEGPFEKTGQLLGQLQDLLDSDDICEMIDALGTGRKPRYKGK